MVLQSLFQQVASLSDELPVQLTATTGFLVAVPVAALALLIVYSSSSTHKQQANADAHGVKVPHRLPGLPIIGNLIEVIRNTTRRHDWLTGLCEQYNCEPFSFAIIGRPEAVMICQVDAVEDILKSKFDNFPKGPFQQELFRDILGHGIFAVDHGKWVHQRKTASNLFTARSLRDSMTEIMRRHAVTLQHIFQTASDRKTPIDVFKLMNRFTIEAFAEIGFGIEMNCLEVEEEHPFQRAFDSAQRMIAMRIQTPVFWWKTLRALSLGTEGQLKKDVKVIDDTVLEIIGKSLARRQQTGAKGDGDIVSLFLDRFEDSADSEGREFDPVYLRDIVVNFLIAGRDTTAQAMSWLFHELSANPQVVTKIRAEIATVLPGLASGEVKAPTMEDVQQLTYLEAALKETLRLHPSVPLIPKHVGEDTVLSNGTFLRKGNVVAIPTYAMARMTQIWGADAKEFKPERWIDRDTNKLLNVSAFKFVSFNAGPRTCLGMNLAMLEMKIVIASILSRFDVVELPGQSITYDYSLTLPVHGEMLARVSVIAPRTV